MSQDLHRRAMALVDEARVCEMQGRFEAAREAYEEAAGLEQRCVDAASANAPRTRDILRVSAVSMWLEAGRYDDAEALAQRCLFEPVLPGFHRELHELLMETRRRKSELRGLATEPESRASALTATLRKVEEELGAGKVRLWAIRSAA